MYRYTLNLVSWFEHDDNVAFYFDQNEFHEFDIVHIIILVWLCRFTYVCISMNMYLFIHYNSLSFYYAWWQKIIKHRLLNGRKRLYGGKNTLHFHAEFRSNFKRPCNDRTFIKKIMSIAILRFESFTFVWSI